MDFNNILGKFNDLGIKNEGLTPDDPAQRQQAQQQKVEVSTQNAGKTDEQLTPNDMAALAGLYIKESKQPTAQKEVIKESINESTDLIQKLSEKWATLKDDALGTAERRPAREGSRHPRGHEPQEQYTIIQDDEENKPAATRDYITKTIASKIKPGLDPDGEEFEKEAYLYHTSELGRRDLLAQGGNWKAYYDAIKWWYKNTNESVEEGVEDIKPKDEEARQILNMLRVFFDDREGYQDAIAIDAVDYLHKKGLLKDFTNSLPYFDEDYEEFLDSYPKDWLEKRFNITEDSVNEGYKGWTYSSHEEDYDDVIKLSHVATKDGKEVSMDWSPYSTPTEEEFKLWVDLGMPTRKDVDSIGPLDKDDLLSLAKTKQGTHKILQRESTEAEKRIATKLKNIERLKTPISDKAWKDHQERMKKEREEYIKKNPDSIFKEEDVLSIKEDPFGQWVLVDKTDGHIKQAFDDKEHAYKYWDHFKLNSKEYKIMHGSEYVDSEYQGLAEYGATSTGSPTSTNQAGSGDQAQKVAAATQAIKSATGSTASQQQIAKAIDTASQGKTDPLTAKTIDPMMDIMKKAAEDPALAQQFKSLAARAKQIK